MSGSVLSSEEEEASTFAAVPCLAALIETILRLLPFDAAAAFTVLELGSGTGVLAAALLARFPHARLTMLEDSSALRSAAERRLTAAGVRADMQGKHFVADTLPRGFDVVVSLLRLHPLDDIARRSVYRGIYAALNPNGLFLVGDRTRPVSAGVLELYARTTAVVMEGPKRGVALANELPWLATIGFRDVDVHYKNLDYAVYGGRRPTAVDFKLVVEDAEGDEEPPPKRR
jgi:tRNA (cmo5U34)-methyltransferase